MNRREARRIANRIAYRFCQQALDVGGSEAALSEEVLNEDDQKKIDDELNKITQRLFERSDKR